MREELTDQLLESAAVDRHADVGQGGGRQEVAQNVACLGAAGPFEGAVALPGGSRRILHDRGKERFGQTRVGVEKRAARLLVAPRVSRIHDARLTVELVAIEDHVARRLLGIGGEAGVLDELARDDGDVFDGQMGHGVLGDRGVTVADHPLLVELPGFPLGRGEIVLGEVGPTEPAIQVEVLFLDQLEEVPSQALAAAAVVGEQNRHHLFGQVPQGENRPLHVGHVGLQDRDLVWCERLAHRVSPATPSSKYDLTGEIPETA